jgi:nucleotide-binding universal stress UspA family protein
MIADIAVNLSVGLQKDVAGDFALSVASMVGAHVSAVAFAYRAPIGPSGYAFTANAFMNWEIERKTEATQAQTSFERKAKLAGVTFDTRVISESIDGASQVFSNIARSYDIAVLPQGMPDRTAEALMIEAALFDSGRPVLVVPYIQTAGFSVNRVLVCWDRSKNAARAVGDAIPLLKSAKKVEIITIEQRDQGGVPAGTLIAEHLARHKLDVEARSMIAPDVDVPNMILSHAADTGADLLVMGGYGHSRLREFVLGGATRGILESMTVPVLMSH